MQEIQEIDESHLRPIFDPAITRQSIMDRTKSAFESKFPLENDKVRLELGNVTYKGKTQFGIHDTKKALMEGRRLSVPLHGDVRLIDKKTGQVLDERRGHLLANVPYMTDRGTFINKGTEYVVVNQSRLRPGIYTRRKDNGELEAHINVKSGTGTGMRMFMEPETGVYRVKVGDSQIKLMPILQRLGVGDDELKSVWGPEVFEANRIAADDQAFEKFYDRLVGARGAAYLRRLRDENAKDMKKAASLSEQDEAWYSALTEAIAKEAETEIAVEDTLRDMGWQSDPETGHYTLIAKAAQIVRIPWEPAAEPKTAAVVVPAKKNDFSVAVKLLEEARSRVHSNPSQKQKENGNYRMGHVRWNGLDITIENPVGSVRSGIDRHGKRWATTMKHDYGYIKGTRGKDGDHIDVFLGPNLESEMVFVIDQDNNGNGRFDEHKCVVGCLNQAEAKELYLSNYQKSWKGFSAITPLTVDEFKWWCYNGDTSKPMSEQHTPKFAADYQGWVGFDLDSMVRGGDPWPCQNSRSLKRAAVAGSQSRLHVRGPRGEGKPSAISSAMTSSSPGARFAKTAASAVVNSLCRLAWPSGSALAPSSVPTHANKEAQIQTGGTEAVGSGKQPVKSTCNEPSTSGGGQQFLNGTTSPARTAEQEAETFRPITSNRMPDTQNFVMKSAMEEPSAEGATEKPSGDPEPEYIGHVAFDLDGTLAYSEDGNFSPDYIGEPIDSMLELAKGLMADGVTIKILTARAADPKNIPAVKKWCQENGLGDVEVTNEKDPGMRALFDDRAIRVAKNEGLPVPLSDELMSYLTSTEKKGTFTGPIEQLKQLKAFSDQRRYAEKNALARKLISAASDDYFIDSSDDRGIVGITHRPTGFRFHMPADQLDPTFRNPVSQKEAVVKFEDGKWKLYTKDGTRVLGTHMTADGAYKQEYAIQKSEERRLKKKAPVKTASDLLQPPAAVEPKYSYTPTAGVVGGVQLTKLQAHLGDEKVGEVFIRQQPGMSHDRITNLFVSEKHRGKGLARSLMERAIADYGKERELRLRANPGFSQGSAPNQKDLIGFYETLGFATFDDQGNMKRSAQTPNLGGISSKLGDGTKRAADLLQPTQKVGEICVKTASEKQFDIASLTSEVLAAITTGKTAAEEEDVMEIEDTKEEIEQKLTPEDKIELVRMQLERMEIDPEISQRNLGGDFKNVGPSALLETSRKLLRINRGEVNPDDRDSKANQTFHSVDDFLEERIMKDAGKVGRTLLGRAGWQGSLKSLKIGHFTPQLDGLIVSNSLSQAVPGINPVELMDIHQKITQMGEGGIPSMDAVPMEARNVHISQIGVIDPIRTPESGGVGIDQRLGSYVRKGPNQQLFMPLIDRRTGQRVWRTPSQVYGKTLLFPRRVPMT